MREWPQCECIPPVRVLQYGILCCLRHKKSTAAGGFCASCCPQSLRGFAQEANKALEQFNDGVARSFGPNTRMD